MFIAESASDFFILVNVWHIYREKVNYVVSTVWWHETTTLLLVTLPNIHQFKKKFSLADSPINLS